MRLTIEELIAAYQLQKSSSSNEQITYSQSAVLSSAYELAEKLPKSFSDVEGWNDCDYCVVFLSDKERAIATYCEGDFSLKISHSEEEYKKSIQEDHDFYVAKGCAGRFTCIPDDQPIAQQAIEEIPGINEQPWRQYHLFLERSYSYKDAIISDPDMSVVLAKAAEIMMADPKDFDQLKKLIGKQLPDYELRNLTLYFDYAVGGLYFGRSSLCDTLISYLPTHFANLNEENTHIELKNWFWYYFSSNCDKFEDYPWLEPYQQRDKLSSKAWKDNKRVEHFSSTFDYLFDVWELEKQGAVKINPFRARVTYKIAGLSFSYEGEVVAYRHVSKPATERHAHPLAVRKQYIIQPDEKYPESCGHLAYWLERDAFIAL
jgi:hypothetical protein